MIRTLLLTENVLLNVQLIKVCTELLELKKVIHLREEQDR